MTASTNQKLMSLFSKETKVNPKVLIEGQELVYDLLANSWALTYKGTDIVCYGTIFNWPGTDALDKILSEVESLIPSMKERLTIGWKEWGNVNMNDGESYIVLLDKLAKDDLITVSWAGGTSWGDMAIDFQIKDHQIIDESWGD